MSDFSKLAGQIVEYVAASSALADRLLSENARHATAIKAAEAKREAVLDVLLQTGGVAPHQKEAATAMLADHAKTLDLLCTATAKMAQFKERAEKSAASLGQAVSEKEASVSSRGRSLGNDPYCGRPAGLGEKRGSDRAFEAALTGG